MNVVTPWPLRGGAGLPVLLFIHGGLHCALTHGPARRQPALCVWSSPGCYIGGSGAIYNSNTLAASAVAIVITFNYRLGVFGFLGGSDVAAHTPDSSTGNFGIQDQREAMRWVAQNAAAFGGDPARVLIFGESAGAGSVAFHTVQRTAAAVLSRGASAVPTLRVPCTAAPAS